MTRVAWSVTVEAPVKAVYDAWTQFEEFPSFMTGVERVEQLDDRHLRWHVDIAGRRASFDAEVTEQIPDARVAWKSLTEPSHSGAVDFHRLDDEVTEIDVMMDVSEEALPGESAGGDSVASRRFEQVVKADLVRFKHLVESSEPASGWRGEVRPEGSGESPSIAEQGRVVEPDAERPSAGLSPRRHRGPRHDPGARLPGGALARAAEVRVRPVEPVLARRAEDVDVQRRLQRLRLVRQVRRDVEHVACGDVDDLRLVLAQPEAEDPFDDPRDLLVLVRVLRDDETLLQVHLGQHHAIAR